MFKKNEYYLLFLFGGVLILITIALMIISFSSSTTPPAISPTPMPSPITSLPGDNIPRVQYDVTQQQKFMAKITNREPLSTSETETKQQILSLLPDGQQSGILHTSSLFIIDYTRGPDIFQVEIKTVNIDSAKKEAVKWFTDQGMSFETICKLPIQFYLNYDIAQSLKNKNVIFSPLAPGC